MSKLITIQSESDFLKIELIKFAYPNSLDTYDKNWLDTIVTLKTGGGKYSAYFQTSDFTDLHKHLSTLYDNLNTEFVFKTLERQLELNFKTDGIGHIDIIGVAQDEAGIGNTLTFELNIDQTDLPMLIQQIRDVIEEFPFT